MIYAFVEEIFNSFSFLRNMFSNEFILCPGATVQVGTVLIYSKLKGSGWFTVHLSDFFCFTCMILYNILLWDVMFHK